MVLTEGQKQAIKKLDKEMEAAKDPCSKYIAEQLLQLATSCPEVSEKNPRAKENLGRCAGCHQGRGQEARCWRLWLRG